ncbi:MAG: EAL domain-containing protein [Alphaproteobacteria bacterium]|nr:EAL domain-containing protein [Alphaproteobacteria bacterium]
MSMFRRQHDQPDTPTSSLGACGYPQPFIDALAKLEATARTGQKQGALILLSVDNLAMIMSGYSMAVAEAVMGELFQLVLEKAGPQASVTRVQRDQFGILMPETNDSAAERWCDTIEDAIRSYSYNSRYGELHCLISTSYQIVPDALSQPEEILGRALVILTESTGSLPLRDDVSGAGHREEMGLANYLGQAVKEGRIRLAYQPIIDARTGAVAHYEALLRLCSEDGSITSAGALIPIAERMGFIPMIDCIVLEKVVNELRLDAQVHLAVNVSNLTIQDSRWLNLLTELMTKNPEVAERLTVEITETAVHGDLKHSARFCAEVQALGCLIALDDFGSGYTSFRQLKTLSIDFVKIDGAFIRDLTDNADSRLFVKILLDFTKGFGLKSVAEFVETGEVAKMLMDLGIDYLQGYYFGRGCTS